MADCYAANDDWKMTAKQKKAILFAPFWRQESHVGNNRVDRFVRWLAEDGYTVVMIRAGSTDGERKESWGQEITVRDRMGLHRDTLPGTAVPTRKPNKFRRALAYWLFNPDPTVVWARAAAKHPAVLKAMEGASFILSSSPPESAHVGAWVLSRCTGVAHIVDMRDGWLDEPLKPLLRSSALRRWLEGRMEARILRDAKVIQVTSEVWQELLIKRMPDLSPKVHVLTNGYPQHMPAPQPKAIKGPDDELVLIHAGRFTGSRLTQLPNLLLEPLLANLSIKPSKGVIRLIGSLSADELKIIEPFKPRFKEIGWRIECPGSMPRAELLGLLPKADGLLLLSASSAALPSKLFEYIPTGKPIFVVTEKDSAAWYVSSSLSQALVVDFSFKNANFFEQPCEMMQAFYLYSKYDIPSEFSENYLNECFMKMTDQRLLSNDNNKYE
jgi:hypothetical protein